MAVIEPVVECDPVKFTVPLELKAMAVPDGMLKFGVLNILNTSARNCNLSASFSENCLTNDPSSLFCEGPKSWSGSSFPRVPAVGCTKQL